MEKGYVYIGRLVDHNGNFVSNYRKLGKTKDFKTREVNLNSTHLPIDVVFVRVFETKHMDSLERILHACYQEYRVEKEYDWRRNILTEWFDVDNDLFDEKINSVITYYRDTVAIDMVSYIESDSGTSVNYKNQVINEVNKSRTTTKLQLFINGNDVTEKTAKLTMARAFEYACEKVGWDIVDESEFYLTKDLNEYKEKFENFKDYMVHDMGNGYFLWSSVSNWVKEKVINELIKNFSLNEMECKFEVI